MGGEISTIQSLKAVDAWIDVINANINGGVRTAFKASRLRFTGSNTDVGRPGNSTSLPLQFPEPSLVTGNTVVDFSQGAITASTENTHLAIQGDGFFMLCDKTSLNGDGSCSTTATSKLYLTRDGEFRTDQNGLLVNAQGYSLCTIYNNGTGNWFIARQIYNDLDNKGAVPAAAAAAVKLSDFLTGITGPPQTFAGGAANGTAASMWTVLAKVANKQSLQYTTFGSTVFDFGWNMGNPMPGMSPALPSDATILNKSLEASNSSMTQSVPELSLAQKLFSALTKVLQTKQTNVDGVLNLVR